jgi:hypothetical protein
MRRIVIVIMALAALGAGTAVAKNAAGGTTRTDAAVTQYGAKDQGCTPGFWKNHTTVWSGFSSGDSFNAVFGVNYDSSLTLLGALNQDGGGFAALARHASAALLNAAHNSVNYGLTDSQIIALVQQAFATNSPESAKNQLAGLNEVGCSIDAHGRPIG